MKRKTFVRAVGLIFLIGSLCLMAFCASRLSELRLSYESSQKGTSLCINEAFVSNFLKYADEDGDYSDWIELYNFGETPLSLDGYYLSDDENHPKKWSFPNIVLAPNQYQIIWLSGKDKYTTEIHANFSVSAQEVLLLTDVHGNTVDKLSIPADVDSNTVYGHAQLHSDKAVVLRNATFGRKNTSPIALAKQLPTPNPPTFSHGGGIFSEPFHLSINAENTNDIIYYTTDGTEPTMASCVYKNPILICNRDNEPNIYADTFSAFPENALIQINPDPVPKVTVVKAKAARNGKLSDSAVEIYYIGNQLDYPILSITGNPEEMFGIGGLYTPGLPYYIWKSKHRFHEVNGADAVSARTFFLDDIKIKTHVALYSVDGNTIFSDFFETEISGRSSRLNPAKNFRISAVPRYTNTDTVSVDLSPSSFIRNSATASTTNWHSLIIRHINPAHLVASKLAEGAGIPMQSFLLCSLYINGEYWGFYHLSEDLNDPLYYKNYYGIEEDNLLLVKAEYDLYLVHGNKVMFDEFKSILQNIAEKSPEEAFRIASQTFDIDNMAMYFAVESMLENSDWITNNIRIYRENKTTSKWKFVLFDLDYAFSDTEKNWMNIFLQDDSSYSDKTLIYCAFKNLLNHPEFRQLYLDHCRRFSDYISENYIQIIDEVADVYESSWNLDARRWSFVLHPVSELLGIDNPSFPIKPWNIYKSIIEERLK